MKKLRSILVILGILLLAVSCNTKNDTVFYSNASRINNSEAVFDEGVLYIKNFDDNLYYLDFNSGQSKVFCQDPSCSHDDDTCGAYKEQMKNYFIAGDHFYFVNHGSEQDTLHISDLNRQNERQLLTFEDKIQFYNIYLYKDTAYFFVEKEMENEDITIDECPSEIYILTFDLKKNEVVKKIPLVSGYSAMLYDIYGIHNEKIIVHGTYLKEYIDWAEEDFDIEKLKAARDNVFLSIDSDTLEYETSDSLRDALDLDHSIEEPLFINAGYLYYIEDQKLFAEDLESKEIDLVYDGELELYFPAEDSFMYSSKSDPLTYYLYTPETKAQIKVYRPEGNILLGSKFLYREYKGKIYASSVSLEGDYEGYKQNSMFIIEIEKDDLGKEHYTAKIVS